MNKPKYEMYQEVNNGVIVGILTARLYAGLSINIDFSSWEKYKDWINKYVYYVRLKLPSKPYSIEELQSFYPNKNYVEIEEIYSSAPLHSVLAVPEEAVVICSKAK